MCRLLQASPLGGYRLKLCSFGGGGGGPQTELKITCGHRSFSAHFTVMSGQLRSRLVMLTGQLFLIVNNLPMQRLLFDYC